MTASPEFSVVIPCHNRRQILAEVIEALEQQEGAPSFEVVLVDDGSTDGTLESLEAREFGFPAQVVSQRNQGPAAARNRGVDLARGRFVAFLGDDTVPQPKWLRSHAEAQSTADVAQLRSAGSEVAFIGRTSWHPRLRRTPFLDYINEYGLQFGYALIDDPTNVGFQFFYTSNLSLRRQTLVENRFDLGFPYAAWEDIELSYRLKKTGLILRYESRAEVLHFHPTGLRSFGRRQWSAGYSAVVFHQLHPELGSFLGLSEAGPPRLPHRGRHRLLRRLALVLERAPLRTPRLWETVLRYHYIEGLRQGWSERVLGEGTPMAGSTAGS